MNKSMDDDDVILDSPNWMGRRNAVIDPQTATDQEIDAWLAEYCMEWHLEGDVWCDKNGHGQYFITTWLPHRLYEQLMLCEEKVRERWTLRLSQINPELLNYGLLDPFQAVADVAEDDSDLIRASGMSELSARARLVVAILLYEREE